MCFDRVNLRSVYLFPLVFCVCSFTARQQDYVECFRTMVDMPAYQNVAARMFTGNFAYAASKTLCVKGEPGCLFTLDMAIKNACNFNFITMA